jgi:hypothetical protein
MSAQDTAHSSKARNPLLSSNQNQHPLLPQKSSEQFPRNCQP